MGQGARPERAPWWKARVRRALAAIAWIAPFDDAGIARVPGGTRAAPVEVQQ
ncbi:hypothetical protein [Sorangium sp. So ce887]|uniref:hypothetical protein n=1 Tax=Sorangium sp. So ce887 TaxID=3133324 RepID=UPI003F642C34